MGKRFAVIGENPVQNFLCDILKSNHCEAELIKCSDIPLQKGRLSSFDKIILAFPSKGENVSFIRESDCRDLFGEKKTVIGGMFEEVVKFHLLSSGLEIYDYFLDEAYVLKNAHLTYQGVLKLLLENTDSFVSGKTALITGFGRIAKPLCGILKSMGVKVYVAVRSEIQACEAKMMGFDVLEIRKMKGSLFYFDFVFNTVPFNVFSENDVKHFKENSVYFEIASKPYGIVADYFGLYGKKYVSASALPGKFYPSGVAENIVDFLLRKEVIK